MRQAHLPGGRLGLQVRDAQQLELGVVDCLGKVTAQPLLSSLAVFRGRSQLCDVGSAARLGRRSRCSLGLLRKECTLVVKRLSSSTAESFWHTSVHMWHLLTFKDP